MTRIDEKEEAAEEMAGVTLPVRREEEEKWGWSAMHRRGIALMVAVMLGVMIYWLVMRPGGRGEVVVVNGEKVDLPAGMDPNVAEAGALSRVPGIGEKTARAIVAYREVHRGEFADGVVYRKLDDLVQAVGKKNKKMIEMCRGYLVFVDEKEVAPHGLKTEGRVEEGAGDEAGE